VPRPITQIDLLKLSTQPPGKVVKFFQDKGHVVSWDWREVWQQEHARAFTVAKAAQGDILNTLKEGMDNAIANGWSERRFLQEMTPKLQALGWWGKQQMINPAGNLQLVQLGSPWRLKTIYRTNMQTSFARGRYRVLAANKVNRPYWLYDAMNDSLTRDSHRVLDNKVWPADHPIWRQIFPPNGFNCRCMVRALTAEQVEQRGLKIETGNALPPGFPDDGWNFNPAEQTVEQLAVRMAPKELTRPLARLPEVIGSKPVLPEGESVAGPVTVFSTAKGVNAERLMSILESVPGIGAERAKLLGFLARHKTATVFASKTELTPPRMKSSKHPSITRRLYAYLDNKTTRVDVFHRGQFNGFTSSIGNYVAVVAKKSQKLSENIKGLEVKAMVAEIVRTRQANDLAYSWRGRNHHWSFSSAVTHADKFSSGRYQIDASADRFFTWLHEIGHQVHFKGGTPNTPAGIDALTVYSGYNSKEWFAEHFVAWLLDRNAFAAWDPRAASYIDEVMDRALQADNPTLPGGVKP